MLKTFLTACLATLLLPATLLAAQTTAKPFRLVVTTTQTPLVPNSVLDLAEGLGYFRREGVDVQLIHVQQTPSAVAALLSGDADMANISTSALLQVVARRGADLKAVMSPDKSIPFLVAARADLVSLHGLAGKSFAIGRPGSLDDTLSRAVMEANGLEPRSVHFLPLGQPGNRARALADGRIDATTVSIGTWLSLPKRDGLHVLVSRKAFFDAAPSVSKVNAVRGDVLSKRRNDVVAVIRAILKAERDFAEHPQRWASAIKARRPEVSPQTIDDLAESYRGSWATNGGLSESELQKTVAFIFEGPDFKDVHAPALKNWVDAGPLREAREGLDKTSAANAAAQPQ